MRLYRFPSFTLLRNHVFVQSSKRFVSFSIDGGLYKIKTQRELTALLCRRRAVCLVQQGASSKKITNIKDILEGQSYEFEVIGEEKSWIENESSAAEEDAGLALQRMLEEKFSFIMRMARSVWSYPREKPSVEFDSVFMTDSILHFLEVKHNFKMEDVNGIDDKMNEYVRLNRGLQSFAKIKYLGGAQFEDRVLQYAFENNITVFLPNGDRYGAFSGDALQILIEDRTKQNDK